MINETELTETQFQAISQMVYDHCGINLHDGKRELVRARIAKRLRVGGFPTVDVYLKQVVTDPTGQEFAGLVDALSTNLTSFFRESTHFDYLTQTFLPALRDQKRKRGVSRVRAWSAGCSTGEEPYTLAMVLLEALAAAEHWDIKLLATDISRPVLETARRAIYHKSRVAAVPPPLRQKYLSAVRVEGEPCFEAAPALRSLIHFNYLNLLQPWPFDGPFDFIFCRNVMIYFDKPTQQTLIDRFYACLEPGGMLFTGHSESLTGINHRFKYVQPTIYAKP